MKHISGLLFFLLSSIFVTAQQKTVVLTFDDAIASHYSVAGPALKQYGFGATFYVCEFPPDFADSPNTSTGGRSNRLRMMGSK